jgi:hypothetical protein
MKTIDSESKIAVAFVIVSVVLKMLLAFDSWRHILPDH